MKENEKIFDCVKLMRDIRDKIHKKYESHPELRKIELERIRTEYKYYSKAQ